MWETLPEGPGDDGDPGLDDVVSGSDDGVVLEKGPDWDGVVEVGSADDEGVLGLGPGLVG